MKKLYYLLLLTICACSHEQVVQPKDQWYYNNGRQEQVGGIERHDAFATYVVHTNAPQLTIHAETNLQPPFLALLAQVTAVVDGAPWRTFHLSEADQEFTLALDSIPGSHEVALVEGSQIRAGEKGDVGFTSITGLGVPQGYTLDSVRSRYTAGLVVWGDSRTVGGSTPTPGLQAWPVLLRKKLPATEIFTPGYGSLISGVHIGTEAGRAQVVEEIATRLAPYQKQSVWFETGVNDFLTSTYTPTQLTEYYQALLPALHTKLPRAKIYLQTDVVAGNERANKLGFTLPQYRAAEAAGAAGLDYVQVVEGTKLGTAADLSEDKIHLSVAGEQRCMERIATILAF